MCVFFFFSSRRRHTRCALVTGVQTCALPILLRVGVAVGRRDLRVRLDDVVRLKKRVDRELPVAWQTLGDVQIDVAVFQLPRIDMRLGFLAEIIATRRRSEEHTSELQSLMRTSYAVFCLTKNKTTNLRNKRT